MQKSKTLLMLVVTASVLVAAPIVYASRGGDHHSRGGHHGATRWAMVDETGTIKAQSGGFRTVDCFKTNANCYIDIGTDARYKGLAATVAAQNNVAGQAISLTGEIAVGACGIDEINCAPPGTDAKHVIVVTPRNSDGSVTTPTTRKRFYVQVLGKPAR